VPKLPIEFNGILQKFVFFQFGLRNDIWLAFGSQILKIEPNFSKRLTTESWFIHSQSKVLNRSDGKSFPTVYRLVL